jgi:beta-glucosidase
MNNIKITFPKNFLWGTATSAYQIEGGITNDWSQWERSPARLKALMNKGKSSTDYICDQAADSYKRYAEDVALAASLNNNAIRFGLEWARIQPEPDTWNASAIEHYRRVLKECKKHKLKTFVTLWHWTNPLWLAEYKYWEGKKTVDKFAEYTEAMVKELGADVDFWITINEPLLMASKGYLIGEYPPNKKNPLKFFKVVDNLAKAHNQAYKIIHEHFPNAEVGLTMLSNYFGQAHPWNPLEKIIAKTCLYATNDLFLNKTKDHLDFIGLDYYKWNRIVWYPPFKNNPNSEGSMGWGIYPPGIYHILKYLYRYKKPIYVLENGTADAEDKHRADFIKQHLLWLHKAIEEGVDVRGYFHWSLLDNFEWAHGYEPKFGLFEVDRLTFERKKRPSAEYYGEVCKNNGLDF